MSILRRILGIFVMIAGILGLVLSLAGLVGLWMVRPTLTASINNTVNTLTTSIDTSQQVMVVTNDALGATVNSVDALAEMLATTADTVDDTQPVITQVNSVMGETLPSTFKSATDSLEAAEVAAQSLESAIKSFDTFRTVLSAVPGMSMFLPANAQPYNPEKPLADSLGELSVSLQDMPKTFEEMSANIDKADDNLEEIKSNLNTMSENVALISSSLHEYQTMIGESQSSMDNLRTMLVNLQSNMSQIINVTSLVLALFFLWLLAAQIVIFSQGWELFQGTAGRMENGSSQQTLTDSASAD